MINGGMILKKLSILVVCIVLFLTVVPAKAYAGTQVKDYIQYTREARSGSGTGMTNDGEIQWIEIMPEILVGIPIKDALINDGRKIAFLTFDDGPSRTITPTILDILKQYNIKATFFIVGSMARSYADIVRRVYSEGHAIGNHSYSHEYGYLYSSTQNFMGEVNSCDSVLKSILGQDFSTKAFRFPGGAFGNTYSAYKTALNQHGYDYINWTTSSGDSERNGVPVSELIENVKQTSYGKDHIVVLMHDLGSKYTTTQALPYIIEYLKSQGYEFRKLR